MCEIGPYKAVIFAIFAIFVEIWALEHSALKAMHRQPWAICQESICHDAIVSIVVSIVVSSMEISETEQLSTVLEKSNSWIYIFTVSHLEYNQVHVHQLEQYTTLLRTKLTIHRYTHTSVLTGYEPGKRLTWS